MVDAPLDADLLADFDRLADVIAAQPPLWPPGDQHGYHGVSLGWYEGELIRRADPRHRSLGRFFAEEVAAPLGLDFYFGLPDDMPRDRLARIERLQLTRALPELRHVPLGLAVAMANPRSVSARTFANPRMRGFADLDRKEYRKLEFPAGGGIGSARAIARAYDAFARGGDELGIGAATIDALTRFPAPPREGWRTRC